MAFRTPFVRESAANVIHEVTRRKSRKSAEDKEAFLQLAQRNSPETPIEELEKARQGYLDGDIEMNMQRGETEDYLVVIENL